MSAAGRIGADTSPVATPARARMKSCELQAAESMERAAEEVTVPLGDASDLR